MREIVGFQGYSSECSLGSPFLSFTRALNRAEETEEYLDELGEHKALQRQKEEKIVYLINGGPSDKHIKGLMSATLQWPRQHHCQRKIDWRFMKV